MITFLALVPILLTLLIFIFRQMQVTLIERQTRGICRVELLKAQEKSGQSISRLLRMNTPVRLAKKTRDAALLAMEAAAATGNAIAFAAALEIYEGAIQTLNALRIGQKALLLKAYADLAGGIKNAQAGVARAWTRQKRTRAELQVLQGSFGFPDFPHVAVRPQDVSDPYPEYVLEDDFQEKQALQVSWNLHWQHLSTRSAWNKKQDWKFSRACAATLVPDQDNPAAFQAKLSEDKFSSKSLFFF